MISNDFLTLVRDAARHERLSGIISVASICREMKLRYGDYDKTWIEQQIEHLEQSGKLEAEYLDGVLLGVKTS